MTGAISPSSQSSDKKRPCRPDVTDSSVDRRQTQLSDPPL